MSISELMDKPAAPSVEQMLTYREAADVLKIGLTTVKKLCKDGDLTAVNVGRQVRIRARDLQTYIDNLGR